MPSFQNPAPGGKSMKFVDGMNPFAPMMANAGEEPAEKDPAPLSEAFDNRLRIGGPSGRAVPAAAAASRQQQQQQQQQQRQVPQGARHPQHSARPAAPTAAPRFPLQSLPKPSKKHHKDGEGDDISDDGSGTDSDDDDDDEFDYLLDEADDDAVLEAIRRKRMGELKKAHAVESEHRAKGHGEVRTVTQDEFLAECTSSKHVVVHFFHDDFERCRVMDHHLKKIADNPKHLSCKFVRIDAAKAPFFVAKLRVRVMPTVILFRDGETVERLLGFEGLVDTYGSRGAAAAAAAENFPTRRLGHWLEARGAIPEYDGPDDSDDEDDGGDAIGRRTGGPQRRGTNHRTRAYDEDE